MTKNFNNTKRQVRPSLPHAKYSPKALEKEISVRNRPLENTNTIARLFNTRRPRQGNCVRGVDRKHWLCQFMQRRMGHDDARAPENDGQQIRQESGKHKNEDGQNGEEHCLLGSVAVVLSEFNILIRVDFEKKHVHAKNGEQTQQ